MSGAQLSLLTSSAALFIAAGVVGVRLLWMANRTRQQPEFLMGAGLVSMIFIYLPMMAVSGIGRLPVGEVRVGVLGVASIIMWFGYTCLFAFTWKAFRADREWAMWLTFAASSLMAATCGGMVASLLASPPEMASFDAAKMWTGMIRVPMLMSFVWTGYEGIRNYTLCRRRQALGLSDPVVTNRFLLWGIVGFSQTILNLVSLTLHIRGVGIMNSPYALFIVAFGGFTAALLMILTFSPPAMYVNFLRTRASGQEI